MVTTALTRALPVGATQFVEPEAYCRLIISRDTLERSDDKERGLLGLVDCETQVRFVVEEQRVLELREVTSP